jgi:uncharacterized membrane protein (DUF4010 family)
VTSSYDRPFLLAILSFIIYPVLPAQAVDPWGLIEPQATWVTVILIAALGFINYVLWKIYGPRGVDIGSFLGGLVNSTAAVAQLAQRVKEIGENLLTTAYRESLLRRQPCYSGILYCLQS